MKLAKAQVEEIEMYFDQAKQKFEKLKDKQRVLVLAFESSCDETSVAVVENGRKILSNVVSTQIPIHVRFGGVVPEVASRNHILAISNVTHEALQKANVSLDDIDLIAVTYGAGLIGALLVGVNFAKALAFENNIPLVAVSHIEGHIAANYLTYPELVPPYMCLLTSGGHTAILKVEDYNKRTLIGSTIDDAVGECFDKVARVLGLGYPGGPKIDKLAREGKANITFCKTPLVGTYNFSFSGVKTAVINYVHNKEQKGEEINKADIAASFEEEVCSELVKKATRAANEYKLNKLVVAGGVSANSRLKELLTTQCQKQNINLFMPQLSLCTDNAAMIGSAAYFMMKKGEGLSDTNLTASSVVKI